MVGAFFAWAVPLLMIAVGGAVWLAGLVGGMEGRNAVGAFVTAWVGIAVAILGLILTGLNVWELFR